MASWIVRLIVGLFYLWLQLMFIISKGSTAIYTGVQVVVVFVTNGIPSCLCFSLVHVQLFDFLKYILLIVTFDAGNVSVFLCPVDAFAPASG